MQGKPPYIHGIREHSVAITRDVATLFHLPLQCMKYQEHRRIA
jgi:hypothetical protein